MGCGQSKIENEESVARCRERKVLMKEAVATRNAYAAAHSGYIVSLKNTGAALNDYGQGEAIEAPRQDLPVAAPIFSDPLPPALPPPPPPPLPDFQHPPLPSPLKRTHSAPPNQQQPPEAPASSIVEEEEDDRGGAKGGQKELLKVLADLDDHFLRASESGYEVSKMLEANRLHYHSNFADNKGTINHSEQVMRVITWNSSFKGQYGSEDGNDDMQGKEKETHASVLDKLLAWENKLYDEVKAGELMKIEYQKKIASLNKQKKRGRNSEPLEKTKAALEYLHTRYMVDFQAMDSTSSEIQRLRDEQLYPNLVELVEGMEKMWKSMYDCHCYQEKIVADLRFDTSNAPEETTKQHHERTLQLQRVANEWHTQSEKLFIHQKQYIDALNNWLRLNLIPIESNLKEKVSSPPKTIIPPMHELLREWHDSLDELAHSVDLQTIKSFAANISRIVTQQQEELKQKKICEEVHAEFEKKQRAFKEWESRNKGSEELDGTEAKNDGVQTEANNKDPFHERKIVIDALKKKVEEEDAKHKRACKSTRDISLRSLETGLAKSFRALACLSRNCSKIYEDLHVVTLKYKP